MDDVQHSKVYYIHIHIHISFIQCLMAMLPAGRINSLLTILHFFFSGIGVREVEVNWHGILFFFYRLWWFWLFFLMFTHDWFELPCRTLSAIVTIPDFCLGFFFIWRSFLPKAIVITAEHWLSHSTPILHLNLQSTRRFNIIFNSFVAFCVYNFYFSFIKWMKNYILRGSISSSWFSMSYECTTTMVCGYGLL